MTREELEKQLQKAVKQGLEVKALAMINPGNPSGNVMSHCDIQVITEFCAENGIVLLADEVYQTNIYAPGAQFVSAKKVALDCGYKNLQLVSFHSTSKGLIGVSFLMVFFVNTCSFLSSYRFISILLLALLTKSKPK